MITAGRSENHTHMRETGKTNVSLLSAINSHTLNS